METNFILKLDENEMVLLIDALTKLGSTYSEYAREFGDGYYAHKLAECDYLTDKIEQYYDKPLIEYLEEREEN